MPNKHVTFQWVNNEVGKRLFMFASWRVNHFSFIVLKTIKYIYIQCCKNLNLMSKYQSSALVLMYGYD